MAALTRPDELEARDLAIAAHGDQRYGAGPYADHLTSVVRILKESGFTGEFLVAGWLHDVIEDTETSVAEIEAVFGPCVAKLVWAVTGGGEREDHVRSIHEKIIAYPDAAVVKLADRIANVEASQPGDKHSLRYGREHSDFAKVIEPHVPSQMWQRYLDALRECADLRTS